MYNMPWQQGRVLQTPVGVLTASFLLRPNTMFHPEGEWSVRLVLPPLQAYRLRQIVAPAYDDIIARAKALHDRLPVEQLVNRPFKENPFWQAASIDGGQETENVYFTFRLPTIDRGIGNGFPDLKLLESSLAKPKAPRRKRAAAKSDDAPAIADAAELAAKPKAVRTRATKAKSALAKAESVSTMTEPPARQEVATRVPLFDRQGLEISGMALEPDGWDAMVSFTVQQYWLRSFGAGVTLRLHRVQLLGQHQRLGDSDHESDLPLPIAL